MKDNGKVNGGARSIFWVGGSKGGVGKSMLTMALLDYVHAKGMKTVLIECDTSNPDVYKGYKDEVTTELINLDERDGWIHLVNVCDEHRESTIVVNTAARNNQSVTKFSGTLAGGLEELQRELVSLWVINRQRDSLELLKEFMEAIPEAAVHVVRNGYFGEEKKFELYNTSRTKEMVESRGGKSVTFPELADRVADDLYTKRLSIAAAGKTLPIGNRMELSRWRGEVRKVLAEIAE
jgi:hypothetical protein